MKVRLTLRYPVLLLALAMVAAACSNDGPEVLSETRVTTTTVADTAGPADHAFPRRPP